ncbi:MAG: sulfotransferase [Rhodothalassiaceae bacterium]
MSDVPPFSGPLVLVGQARSGSTLLTRLLAESGHFCLVNDAYLLQAMDDIMGQNGAEIRRLSDFCHLCIDRVAERSTADGVRTINRSVLLSAADIDALRSRADALVQAAGTPAGILQAVLQETAQRAGARVWGWNSPQDYLQIDRIARLYPHARFVFLIRDPFAVLRSYKSLPAYWGAERNRYHPVLQALVWRNVVREHRRLADQMPERVRLVRYEDLVEAPQAVWTELATLTGAFPPPPAPQSLDRNSSRAARAQALSRVEQWLCGRLTAPDRSGLGYQAPAPLAGPLGLGDLIAASFRAGLYYSRKAAGSRDMRGRIARAIRRTAARA